MKKIILLALALVSTVSFSQEEKAVVKKAEESYKPKVKSFTTSIMLGRGRFLNQGGVYSYPINSTAVPGTAPTNNVISTNSNSLVNMAGVEGKYFYSTRHAFTLELGMMLSHTPYKINIQGTGNQGAGVVLPAYDAVVGVTTLQFHAAAGMQWYFNVKSPRLLPYAGFSVPFDLTNHTSHDPTIDSGVVSGNVRYTQGASRSELISTGLNLVAGVDYYVTRDMFIGFDVKPFTMQYAINGKKPTQYAPKREAENYSYSAFASYNFKIGFNLGSTK